MRIAVGSDHAGYPLKEHLASWLAEKGHAVYDLGTHSSDPVDYPDYAAAVARAVLDGRADRGVVVCGSGAGAAIAANKLQGIRAGVA
ncbi:MAG TPA: RpiB/LacA/LacB family sugar-phosphate isomerase, partial [Acidimicrobiia bacterium]